jgi:hypothetical protein
MNTVNANAREPTGKFYIQMFNEMYCYSSIVNRLLLNGFTNDKSNFGNNLIIDYNKSAINT